MKRMNFPSRKDQRREEAMVRQALRNERSDKQQLNKLLAHGYGECKEAKKLREKVNG